MGVRGDAGNDTVATMRAAHADFDFRPMTAADLPMLHAWRLRPHLQPWWFDAGTLAAFEARYLPRIAPTSHERGFIVWHQGQPFAFMQSYAVMSVGGDWWPQETDPGARGIDQFLANAGDLGLGLGAAMVRAFNARLFTDATVSRVQTDPHPDNARAIASYRRAGFVDVGVVHTPDGPALLMHCTRESLSAALHAHHLGVRP